MKAERMKKKFDLECDIEDIEKAICILDCNSHMAQSKSGETLSSIYETASLFNHNCKPNARTIITSDYAIKVVSTGRIDPNCEITISYLDPFRSTLERRNILWLSKCFKCNCNRCLDPYDSSVKCQNCQNGFLLRRGINLFECQNCQVEVDENVVSKMESALDKEYSRINFSSINCVEKFLSVYEKLLHGRHPFLCRLRQFLIEGK